MNQITTRAIILSRTDFGEADRILTLLTPDHGKLSLIAKGVRRVKSKLAGGIELFSVSDIGFIRGRGEVGTLVSARLVRHYETIVRDVNRTMLGYDLIKQLHKSTEDQPEPEYFGLLEETFEALNTPDIPIDLIRTWFSMQLLRLGGHTPNLQTDVNGSKLAAEKRYDFSFDDMAFMERPDGAFSADEIKFLRLGFASNRPEILNKISGVAGFLHACMPLIQTMASAYVHI